MRAIALYAVISVLSLSVSSGATAPTECGGRIEHLGSLSEGIAAEKLQEAMTVLQLLQRNGLFYAALVETLKAHGITPQKRAAWEAFTSHFYMVPERDAITAETTGRLLYEFFKPSAEDLDQAVIAGARTGMGAALFLETRKVFRSLQPLSRWKDLVELLIFNDSAQIHKELNLRMRGWFPRRNLALLAGFPPAGEVQNSYAALPVELVTFDAQLELQTGNAARIDALLTRLRNARLQNLPVFQQAELRAIDVRQGQFSQRVERARLGAIAQAQSMRDLVNDVDEQNRVRAATALAQSLKGIQDRIASLQTRHDALTEQARRQTAHTVPLQQLAEREVEKTGSAVQALRKTAAARRKFLSARRTWRQNNQPGSVLPASAGSTPVLPLALQLRHEGLQEALYADEIDHDEVEKLLVGEAPHDTAADFTATAVYALHFLTNDSDVTYNDSDLANLADTILKAAGRFRLTANQVHAIRSQLMSSASSLENEDSVDDDESIQYHRALYSLQWLQVLNTDQSPRVAMSDLERTIREENFRYEMDLLIGDQDDEQVSEAVSALIARQLTPEQLTVELIAWLQATSPDEDEDRAELVDTICEPLWNIWSHKAGLSEPQIARLREAIRVFASSISDDDEEEKVKHLLLNGPWLNLSKRYTVGGDVAVVAAKGPSEPSAVAPVSSAMPTALEESAEVLPPELLALRDRWQTLASVSRPLRADPAVVAALDREDQIRADLRAMLKSLTEVDDYAAAVENIMTVIASAHRTLSLDRFTAVVADIAILSTFRKQWLPSGTQSEREYLEALFKTLKYLPLGSANASRIAQVSLWILGVEVDQNGTRLVYNDTEGVLLPLIFDQGIFARPNGLRPEDSALVQSALRELIQAREEEVEKDAESHASLNRFRAYAANAQWAKLADRNEQATAARLRAIEWELAEAEQALQRARAVAAAVGVTP